MDKETERMIVEMYEAKDERGRGISIQQICIELDIHPPDVYKVLRENRIPMRRTQVANRKGSRVLAKYPDEVQDLVLKLYREKRNANKVSGVVGIPYQHVLLILHAEKEVLVRGRKMNDGIASVEEIQERLERGMSVEMTAADLGVSTAEVLSVIGNAVEDLKEEATIAGITAEVLRRAREELERDVERGATT